MYTQLTEVYAVSSRYHYNQFPVGMPSLIVAWATQATGSAYTLHVPLGQNEEEEEEEEKNNLTS